MILFQSSYIVSEYARKWKPLASGEEFIFGGEAGAQPLSLRILRITIVLMTLGRSVTVLFGRLPGGTDSLPKRVSMQAIDLPRSDGRYCIFAESK